MSLNETALVINRKTPLLSELRNPKVLEKEIFARNEKNQEELNGGRRRSREEEREQINGAELGDPMVRLLKEISKSKSKSEKFPTFFGEENDYITIGAMKK